jgi:hypothetical protein
VIPSRAAVLGVLIALAAAGAAAQPLDSISQDALNKTLQILLDPTARSGELGKNSQGAALDAQVRALAGSDALTQELYAVAGQVLTELVQNSGGDTQKMLQAVERAKTDPAGFAAMLSPATQQRLRDLSVKISDQRR